MLKKYISLLAVSTIVAGNGVVTTITNSQFKNSTQNLKPLQQAKLGDGEVIDVNQIGFYALKAGYAAYTPDYSPNNPIVNVTNITNTLAAGKTEVTEVGKPDINPNADTIFIGSATLRNETDERQTLQSQSFSQTIEHSTTTSLELGFSIGGSFEYAFQPEGVGSKITITAQFNYNHTSATTDTTSSTVTAPSQQVTLPPKTEAIINVTLNKVAESIRLNLKGYFSGDWSGTIHLKDGTTKTYSLSAVAGITAAKNAKMLPYSTDTVNVSADYQSIYLGSFGDILTTNDGSDYTIQTTTQPI